MLTYSRLNLEASPYLRENFIDGEEIIEEKKEEIEETKFECKNDRTFSELMKTFIAQNKGMMSLYFMFLLIHPLKNALIPHLMGKIYTKVQNNEPIKYLMYIVVSLVVLLQVVWVFAELVEIKIHPLLQKYMMDEIIHHVFRVNEENYNDQQVSSVVSSISKFPVTCYNYISQLKSFILPSVIGLIVIGFYLLYLDYVIGLFYVLILTIGYISLRYALKSCDMMSYDCDQKTGEMYGSIDDTVHNMSTILNFEQTENEINNITDKFVTQRDICGKTFNCTLVSKYCIIPLMVLFVVISLGYFYKRMKSKKIDQSKFISIIVVNFMVMNITFNLTSVFKDMIIRMGVIQSSMKIFDECKVIPQYSDEEADFKEGIQFKNVDFSRFVDGKKEKEEKIEKPIFTDLNVHFPKGKTTLVMGKIGSGKSTLINLISKNQTILRGNIFIDGQPIQSIKHLKHKVFYVPQTPILFNRTIYENINYGLDEPVDRDEIVRVMRKIGLASFYESLPRGIDSSVGLLGSHLSGGQRQMIWLMKLFFVDPEYIIMDEPTSAVDEDSKDLIHTLLRDIMKDKTVIMITHDEYLTKLADLIIYMEDGKIVTKI